MSISIRHPEVEILAKKIAETQGCSMTEAILRALEQMQQGTMNRKGPRLKKLKRIAENCAALPDLDTRPYDEILGYNKDGLL